MQQELQLKAMEQDMHSFVSTKAEVGFHLPMMIVICLIRLTELLLFPSFRLLKILEYR